MADNTKIEWTDATWNPITGCSVVSPGCTNCYAMGLAGTRLHKIASRKGLTKKVNGKHVWTGEVRFNQQWLTQPLQWSKPRMIFVCAHGDLFAEGVKDEWLDQIFAVMALAPQHAFQVLTKRPERMREYLQKMEDCYHGNSSLFADRWGVAAADVAASPCAASAIEDRPFPLPNVWLGVSVEDQRRADERIPILLDTPAALRWISAEPLLGPLNLRQINMPDEGAGPYWIDSLSADIMGWFSDEAATKPMQSDPLAFSELPALDWVVAGGESGQNARPMHPTHPKSLRDQCAAAGVPFLFKQWGNHLGGIAENHGDGVFFRAASSISHDRWLKKSDKFDWFDGKRSPDGPMWLKVTKSEAGRLLDGVEHNAFPTGRAA